jgi:hypothetical protein
MHLAIVKLPLIIFALAITTSVVHAETVTPLQGQSPEQTQSDISACKSQAGSTATPPPASTSQGGRMRGATTAAVASSVASEVRGNQYEAYEKIDDDVKKEYRQENAKDAAVAGAVVGGSKQRRANRNASQQAAAAPDASQEAYTSCMVSKGYSVTY